jgi:hypothetical protein
MSDLRPLVTPGEAQDRLSRIFPREGFDTVLSNPLSASAISTMIYAGAVENISLSTSEQRYARPSMVMWLDDAVLSRSKDNERDDWYQAASRTKQHVRDLLSSWQMEFTQRYEDNTRETLRDETLPRWREQGAVLELSGLATSSSKPRWMLQAAFAALFDPALSGEALESAIDSWISENMTTMAKLKAMNARTLAKGTTAVIVTLPSGVTRYLEPGGASEILKGVVEQWAPSRLHEPMVLTISEPGDKVYVADQQALNLVGISIDVAKLLPDALLADVGVEPAEFWIVEAVFTDGPVTEARKDALISWAKQQGIPADQCRFLTAFMSRNSSPAKRRLKDLAAETFAWFLDEPTQELSWSALTAPVKPTLAIVTPIHH